jgi:hypothetical protein
MGCSCKKNGDGSHEGWSAIVDTMPPEKPRLRVTGTAECTTTGYKDVHLVEHHPQGINPRVLLLELKWTAPTGIGGDVVTPHVVRFDKNPSPIYEEVEIVNCDLKIEVEVVT